MLQNFFIVIVFIIITYQTFQLGFQGPILAGFAPPPQLHFLNIHHFRSSQVIPLLLPEVCAYFHPCFHACNRSYPQCPSPCPPSI